MNRLLWIWSALAALSLGAQEDPGPAPEMGGSRVVRIRIEGPLDVGTRALLRRAVQLALADGADLLVELDTPGGEVELMWQLARQLEEASQEGVRTVAWVNDRAISAGALIAVACEQLLMRTQATIGAAAPVVMGPGGAVGGIEDDTMAEKVTSAVRSSFRGWAERRGRPPALVEAMVDVEVGVKQVGPEGERRLMTQNEFDDATAAGEEFENVRTVVERGKLASFSGTQAVELGLADGLADTLEEVLERMGATQATLLERARSEDLAALLHSVRFLLLLGGLVGAYLELKMPGFGIPGILSILCFAVFLFGQYTVGLADVPHMVMVGAGLALIAVEIFIAPGTIWFGVAGAALLIGGLLMSIGGSSWDLDYALDRRIAFDAVFSLALWSTAAMVIAWGLSRLIPYTPGASRLVLQPAPDAATGEGVAEAKTVAEKRALVGAVGEAITDLRPVGRVTLDGEPGLDFEARTAGTALDRGARVRVIEVRTGRLVVEPEVVEPEVVA